jgi:NTP pyrophosphatase (non-canonical NTP hydrolase)
MTVREFQELIERIYYGKDSGRGLEPTFMWFVEEVGELSRALRRGSREELEGEFADVAAWLFTLASIAKIDMEQAVSRKYGAGCPKCGRTPCTCEDGSARDGRPSPAPS